MSALQGGKTKATRVVSLRLPSPVDAKLRRSAADVGWSVSAGLDWLLRNSFGNCQLIRQLADCPDVWDSKLDARIPVTTFEQLRTVAEQLGISVYIRKLLYHFYVTRRLKYVQVEGRYTLAGHHE